MPVAQDAPAGRVIFLNYFIKEIFTGGIKTTYRHAALLNEMGIKALVWQPEPPDLLKDPVQRALACKSVNVTARDVIVFPEVISGWFEENISRKWPCVKVMFCQNPFYLYSYKITAEELKRWEIERMIVPSGWSEASVRSVMGFDDIKVVTPIIDTRLFSPRPKKLKIIAATWKWDDHPLLGSYGALIRQILYNKHPDMADIPWVDLRDYSETEVAELMGEAAICLVLGRAEALGMTALEAMASECLIVGFEGGGGADFATRQNGFWHAPEDIEGVADSLALAVEGYKHQMEFVGKMRYNARQTACYYDEKRTIMALKDSYQDLFDKYRS